MLMIINKQIDMNDITGNTLEICEDLLKYQKEHPQFHIVDIWRKWEYSWLLSHIELKKDLVWLDIGPGDTIFPFYLHDKGVKVTVTEVGMGETFKKYPGIRYIEASEMSKLKSNSFDVVSNISVVEHIDKDGDTLLMKEINRVLKSKGMCYVTTDFFNEDNYRPGLRAGRCGDLHWHWYSISTFFEKIINPSGLEIVGNRDFVSVDFSKGTPGMNKVFPTQKGGEHNEGPTILCMFMRKP